MPVRLTPQAALLAIALALAAGCARPAPSPAHTPVEAGAVAPEAEQPPAEAPEPASPALAPSQPEEGCARNAGGPAPRGSIYGGLANPPEVHAGTCALSVPTRAISVDFVLPDGVTEQAARTALQVSGALAGEPSVTFDPTYANWLSVKLPAGKAGDQVNVRLEGPVGPAGAPVSLGFALTRREAPSVTAEYRDEQGQWVPVLGGESLPLTTVTLRFRGTNIDPGSLTGVRAVGKGARISYTSTADALEAEVTGAPAGLHFDFTQVANKYGLTAAASVVTLYLGAPPSLVALDPATGKETAFGEVPPDVFSDSLSPDGRWAVLKSLKPDDARAEQVTLVRLAPFGSEPLPVAVELYPAGIRAVWAGGKLILPAYQRLWEYDLSAGSLTERPSLIPRWGTASPDGRLLVGYSTRAVGPEPDRLALAEIWVRNLATGEERSYGELVHAHRPFEWYPYVHHAWRGGVLALSDEAAQPDGRRTVLLDLTTGKGTVSDEPIPYAGAQPDEWAPGPGGWAYRKLYAWDWGGVTLRAPDGAERLLGQGKILGWLPDGRLLLVHWENQANRRELPGH